MKIKLNVTLPVSTEEGMTEGRVLEVLSVKATGGRGTRGWWVQGNVGEVLVLSHEATVIDNSPIIIPPSKPVDTKPIPYTIEPDPNLHVTTLKDIPSIGTAKFTFENYDGSMGGYYWDFVNDKFHNRKEDNFVIVGWCHADKLAVRPREDSVAVMIHDLEDDIVFWFHIPNWSTVKVESIIGKD